MDDFSAQDIKKRELEELRSDALWLDVYLKKPDLFGEDLIPEKYFEIENSVGALIDLCPDLSPQEIEEIRKTLDQLKNTFCHQLGSEKLCSLLNNEIDPLKKAQAEFNSNIEKLLNLEMSMDEFIAAQQALIDQLGPDYRDAFADYLKAMSQKYKGIANLTGFLGDFTGPILKGGSGLAQVMSAYYEMFESYAQHGPDGFDFWWTNVWPTVMVAENVAEYFSSGYGLIGRLVAKPIASGIGELMNEYFDRLHPQTSLPRRRVKHPVLPPDSDDLRNDDDRATLSDIERMLDMK